MNTTVKHNLPEGVLEVPVGLESGFPELVKLIVKTQSMDFEERKYWISILPQMTDDHIDRLFDILETERRKLEELDSKYQAEITALNQKHLQEWDEFQALSLTPHG